MVSIKLECAEILVDRSSWFEKRLFTNEAICLKKDCE